MPITVFTGFLGSGKTTLLSRILSEPSLENTAVLVNEFGEVGLDHHLLRRVDERTVLLGNGCVCCAMRGDLVESLVEVLGDGVERVIIETTGLADPAPILFTVTTDPVLLHRFEVASVVTTVDAANGNLHLAHPEAAKQIAAADTIVVTKTDMVDGETIRNLTSRLARMNPSANVTGASFGDVEPSKLLRRTTRLPNLDAPGFHDASDTHSVAVTFDGAVEWAAFGAWLSMLLHARGEDVLRVKGLLDVGENGPVVLDGVNHTIHPPRHLDEWPDDDHRTRIVFITKGVEADEILASLGAFARILGASPHSLRSGSASTSSHVISRPG